MAIYPQTPNDWLQSQAPIDQKATSDIRFEGLEINPSGDLINIPVVYGYRRVIGPRVLTKTKLNNTNVLYTVIAVSEGQITKFDKIVIDDFPISISGVGNGTRYLIPNAPYTNLIEIQPFTGTGDNTISTLLAESTGNDQDFRTFTTTMVGIAYVVVKMTYNAGSTPFKQFPKIAFDVCGRRLRPANTLGSETSVLSNANPADVLLDYLTNTVYGANIADSKIDTTSLTSLRSSFETVVTPYVNGSGIKRAFCDYVLDTGRSVLDNVREICRQFGIIMTLANGKYRFAAETSGSTYVLTVDKDNLIGSYQEVIPDLNVRYNTVNVIYPDEAAGFSDASESSVNSDGVIDDGKVLRLDIRYDAITNPYVARFMSQQILNKSRSQRLYSFTLTKTGLQLIVGDLVLWDPTSTGTSTDLLRVIGLNINADFTVNVEAVTHRNDFYPPFTPGNRANLRQEIIPTPPGQVVNPPVQGPTQPVVIIYPQVPEGDLKRKITVTKSGKPGWTSEPPKLTGAGPGTDFYRGPITRINRNATTVSDANYQLDNLSFSLNSGYGHFGVDSLIKRTADKTRVWAEHILYLTYRDRDIERQNGEGSYEYSSSSYDRLYFVYEVDNVGGNPVYGAYHSLGNSLFEKLVFDPDTGSDQVRYQSGSSAQPLALANQDYNLDRVYLGKSKGINNAPNYFGFPTANLLDNSYFSTQSIAAIDNLYYLLKGQYTNAQNCIIPKSVWEPATTYSDGDSNQLITVKFFVIKGGAPKTIGHMSVNLGWNRFADSGSSYVERNRTNYKAWKTTAPF